MKKIMVFLFLLIALCLIVSCGDASSSTETTASVNTTNVPDTTSTTTDTKPMTTTPATTKTVEVTTPETTEDDGMYRAGFQSTSQLMVMVTYVAYEIPKEASVLAEKIPITLYFGISPSTLKNCEALEDAKFVFTLRTEENEEVCSLGELTLAEIKAGNYTCEVDYDTEKISYADSGKTYDLDSSLFTESRGLYSITVDFHSEQAKDGWYDQYVGITPEEGWFINDSIGLTYSRESSKNAFVFGVSP